MSNGKLINHDRLLSYFADHLNLIYCAKLHIVGKLPEMAEFATFADLKYAILETHEDIVRQIDRMNEIYKILNTSYSAKNCATTLGLIEDSFKAIAEKKDDPVLRDLSILFYMQNLESIEVSSFKILQMTAAVIKNDQISQLITENFDEAKEDRKLLILINAKYLIN